LCGNRTLVGETPKRTNTDHRADKHKYTKKKNKENIKKKKKETINPQNDESHTIFLINQKKKQILIII